MTCDSLRPCQRCIKRGLQDSCVDAPRKRKKYLSDVPPDVVRQASPELVQHSASMPTPTANTNTNTNTGTSMYYMDSLPYDMMKRRSKFLSTAADLEYSTLSSIISADNVPQSSTEHTPNTNSPALTPAMDLPAIMSPKFYPKPDPTSPNTAINEAFLMPKQKKSLPQFYTPFKYDDSINQYFLGPDDSNKYTMYPEVHQQVEDLKAKDPIHFYNKNNQLALSCTVGILPEDLNYTRVQDPNNTIQQYIKEPEDIYELVKKPYSYTPGYHRLIAYLRKRFSKEMLVQMVESMAAYRPSFIACTNALKEHDLIFMEKCFQRTLLTYDLIIKVSGTPTIVWRRTGEIAYVGNEFCILTGWTKQELLLEQKRFIVELLDDKLVLEYFQLFLRIAFGDFFGATMLECTLLTRRKDVKIRTRCSWTLKRDVFGIPMMIIGNFLPIFD